MICATCSSEIQPGARFCSACGQRVAGPEYIPVQEAAARAGLVRPLYGSMFGGVCAGFARRYGWDVALVRLAMVALVLFGCGLPIIGYIVAWVVMPKEPFIYPVQPMAAATPVPDGTQTQV